MNKIAVIMNRRNKEYLSYLCQGFDSYAKEHSVIIHMYLCFEKPGIKETMEEIPCSFYKFPCLDQYDGVIIPMDTMVEKDVRDFLLESVRRFKIPCVTIEQECNGMSWTGIDQKKALHEIVAHMVKQHGVSSFCYLGGVKGTYEAALKKEAFLEELETNGLIPETGWMFDGRDQYVDGIKIGNKLFEEFNKGVKIPEAVICANDEMAAGVYDVISKGKLKGKVGVTGFDFYRNGEYYRPYMTTVARPREETGYESCSLLEEMISKGSGWTGKKKLDYHIIIGNTCGCNAGRICDESETISKIFFDEHQKNVLLERIELMEEQTTRDIHRTELAEGILDCFRFLGGSYIKIMVSKEMITNESTDYRQCDDVLVEWTKDAGCQEHGGFFTFIPLHFQSRIMGYVCMAGIDRLLFFGLLEIFIKNICLSLENYIQKKRYSEINRHYHELFMTDQLTGLYNRFGLKEYGFGLYEKNCMEQKDTHIIFCDINRLKYINDTYGHPAGDWAICAVGKALKAFQTEKCLPFRYGGDEYIVLVQTGDIQKLVSGIEQKLKEIQAAEPQEYHVSISIGSFKASWRENEQLETYFTKADELMYQQKRRRLEETGEI